MAKSGKVEPKEIDRAAGVAKALGVTKGDVNESVDVLKEYAPDVGTLAAGALEGPIGLTLAISVVVKRHTIDEWEEEGKGLDELAELLAKPLGADIEDYNRHAHEAKLATAELESKLANAGADPDPIGTRSLRPDSPSSGHRHSLKLYEFNRKRVKA
jgi:hypothetical protein